MSETIVPFEAGRMWVGAEPWLFYLEIVFRSTIGYLYCILLMRALNGRTAAQVSKIDLVLVIALGSAVGDLTLYNDVPILHALTVVTVIISLTKLMDLAQQKSETVNRVLSDPPVVIVKHGVIDQRGLKSQDLNALEVMEQLRLSGVRNLGQVEWAFQEASGAFSVFFHDEPEPGLPIVPPHDLAPAPPEFPLPNAGEAACCQKCGTIVSDDGTGGNLPCPNCGAQKWTRPVTAERRQR